MSEPFSEVRPHFVAESSRLQHTFAALLAAKKGGIVVYIMAADPDVETSLAILRSLPRMGVDVIELGVPFSDPLADGPILQRASQRALKAGGSLVRTLEIARLFRTENNTTPLILMGYYNPIYVYGPERFAKAAAAVGIDGCIIVDLPPEEADEVREFLKPRGIDFIVLATPTTDSARVPFLLEKSSGFIYYVSVTGTTGTISATQQAITQAIIRLRHQTERPIAVGFGIMTPEQVAAGASVADAVVVGSAVIQRIADCLDTNGRPRPGLVEDVLSFIKELAIAAHTSRKALSLRRCP